MSFDETRLPEDVERGAQGGPEFKTTVLTLTSGYEKRNIDWSSTRGSWDVSYGIQSLDDLRDVIAFFYARQGRARGFRFKDWSDYAIASKQGIGIGNGTNPTFQIYKRYSSGGIDYDRILKKIVNGSLVVWLDNVIQVSGFAIDYNTGIITFTPAPTAAVVVSVTCEYDVPVRFDTDKLNINMDLFNVGQLPSIPLVELKI